MDYFDLILVYFSDYLLGFLQNILDLRAALLFYGRSSGGYK
jgi:hypothetical protein